MFKVGGKNETWHKDAPKVEEIKLIESHAKINVKAIPRGLFLSLPMTDCKEENVKFLHFEFIK